METEGRRSLEKDEGSPERTGFQPRELSKYEIQEMEKAKLRHKENIVKPQVIMGKEFKGPAFIPKPDKIIFKDFDLGQMHVQTIQMTNGSLSFNSLKLLELNENVKDFFTIIYKPSGRVGAGISVPVTIKFLPQLNQDIFDSLPFLSETGSINVPIECTCKKAVVRTEQKEIVFSKVIFGESQKQFLKLRNDGALETEIIFKNKKGIPLGLLYDASTGFSMSSKGLGGQRTPRGQGKFEYDQEEEKIINQLKFEKKLRIKGYSELSIPIEFVPTEIGNVEYPLIVYFENYLHSPPIDLLLKCECIDVPIYVEKPLYDFQICLLNHIYREKIVFFNRSSIAMKVQIEMPKESKKFFEFNPSLGYIQGGSKFEIWVKFIADPDLLKICKNFFKDNIVTIPFKLIGADQEMPVDFEIRIEISTEKVIFTPQVLDFGRFYEQTAPTRNMKIENLSDLPQEIIFFPLPKNIKVFPDLIPVKILPKETVSVTFTYKGYEIGTEENHIRCKIATGTIGTRETRILYKAEVLRSPLQFSSMRIDLPALQINEKYPATLTVFNQSNRPFVIEFFLPYFDLCGLKFTPMVATIEGGKSLDVMIEYYSFIKKIGYNTLQKWRHDYETDPNKNFQLRLKMKEEEEKKKELEEELRLKEEEEKKKGKKAPPPKKEEKKPQKMTKQQQAEYEAEQQRLAEEERRHEEEERLRKEALEKNFDSVGELQKLGGKFYAFNDEEDGNYNEQYEWLVPCYFAPKTDQVLLEQNRTYIQVNTVTVMKNLVADQDKINFGEIAVGFRKLETLLITNKSEHIADMKMDLLPLYGGFNVIGALRSIAPGKTKRISIEFCPHEQQKFDETLRIFTSTSMVSVKLAGSGVKPEVNITPETGILNMGGVVHGEHIEKIFKISNKKNFPLNFRLISQAEGVQNRKGKKVFSYVPAEGVVEANKEKEIRVIFSPDRISEKFYELVLIDVPNQIEPKSIFIVGHCFPRQAYFKLYKPLLFPNKGELDGLKLEYPLDYLTIRDEETIYGSGNNRLVLEFKRITGDTVDEAAHVRKISIGSCKMIDPKNEKPTNYDITMPKEDKQAFFSVDQPKGSVPSGQETVITFKFKPPEADQFIANIEAIQGIGQWIEQKAEIKITGGFIKQGTTDLILMEIILRAYVNQF